MDFEILYWHWIIFGISLALVEIFLPSFTALWFGLGAVLVGIIQWLFPTTSLTLQVVLWAIFSIAFTMLWFKYLKPLAVDKTKAGLSMESIVGEVGQVLSIPYEHKKGMLRFPAPILGADEWLFISEDNLVVGDRVQVFDVSGNSLMVKKL